AAPQEDAGRISLAVRRIGIGPRRHLAGRQDEVGRRYQRKLLVLERHERLVVIDRDRDRAVAVRYYRQLRQHELVVRIWLLRAMRRIRNLARLDLTGRDLVQRETGGRQLRHRGVHAKQNRHLDHQRQTSGGG